MSWVFIKKVISEWRGVLVTVPTTAGLLLLLRMLGWLQPLEIAVFDQFMRWRPAEAQDSRIVIIGMDETDIQQLGWPLSDAQLADLLAKIRQQKPLAIGLDLYRDLPVREGKQALNTIFETTPNLIGIERVIEDGTGSRVAPPPLLAEFGQVAANDVVVDADGKLRRALLFPTTDDEPVPSLGLLLALLYLDGQDITSNPEAQNLTMNGVEFVPIADNTGGYWGIDAAGYQVILNFRGPARSFETVTIRDVLSGKVSNRLMYGRIVLVGATAASLNDIFYTPYTSDLQARPMPGVEIQANVTSHILSAVLEGREQIQSWSEPIKVQWLILWTTIGAVVSWLLKSPPRVALFILLSSTSCIGSGYLALLHGWWIPVIPPLAGLVSASIIITGYIAVIERDDRRLVMNLFGRHVSPTVAEAIWRDRDQILTGGRLPGRQLTATVLFTDLRDFSSIAEQTDPELLMNWLNEYMETMAKLVLDHNGVVDKFIGDAVMAVFGVPIPRTTPEEIAQDAHNAVCCALAMAEQLQLLNTAWLASGRPTATMRVGISTGAVVSGSLGSAQRLDYTTIGDTVNIAARLESYSKTENSSLCRILISEETHCLVKDTFLTQFIGTVILKGRKQSVNAYRIVSPKHHGQDIRLHPADDIT